VILAERHAGAATLIAAPAASRGRLTMPNLKTKRAEADLVRKLRHAGLRATRQRVALAALLFRGSHRHVTPEILHQEATDIGALVSLATVYNTLHQFTDAGLLCQSAVDVDHFFFDTNTGPHQHFYIEDERLLIDIPGNDICVTGVPTLPAGTNFDRVDVIVRLKRKTRPPAT
jgi:Fur family iron response transcriptional regulator